MRSKEFITEKWSQKYKRSINCNNPKGFSQRAHCQGRKKTNESIKKPGQWTVDAIREVLPIAKEIWFHGSRAIGKHKRTSDTDILVVVPDEFIGKSYLRILRILQKLSRQHKGYDIQPTHANTNIHRIAQEEGKLLWKEVSEAKSNDAESFITKALKKAGYKFIGSGYDAQVWMKDEGTVVKILMPKEDNAAHDTFKTFYQISKKLDSPNLPKFKEVDGSEVFNFTVKGKPFVQYGMEQLHPLKRGSLDEWIVWMLADYSAKQYDWKKVLELLKKEDPNYSKKLMTQNTSKLKEYKILYKTLRTLHRLGQSKGYGWDPHTENVMQRNDGTLVITDPWA